jgi:hypothetical protein
MLRLECYNTDGYVTVLVYEDIEDFYDEVTEYITEDIKMPYEEYDRLFKMNHDELPKKTLDEIEHLIDLFNS